MILTDKDLKTLAQIAESAAVEAGRVISEFNAKSLAVQSKAGASSRASEVVTEADFKSQEIVLEALAPTLNRYDLALLSEESPDDSSRFAKDYFWCIDPLDGTLSFIDCEPGYAVSIALVSRTGEPLIGVVYAPATETLYSAVKNQGLRRNSRLWQPELNPESSTSTLQLAFDRSFFKDPLYQHTVEALNSFASSLGYRGASVMHPAGGVMNSLYGLEQSPACYFKFPKPKGGSIWDYAATSCIYKEAGAAVSDIFGAELDLNRPGSTYMNHRGFVFATEQRIADFVMNFAKSYLP